jgi:hypothetical protein
VSPNFTVTLPIAKAPLQLKGSAKLNGIALKAPLPAKEGQAASQIDVSGVTGDLQFKKNIIDVENLNLEIEKQALEATASITGLPKPQEASFNVTSKEVKLHGILSKLQPEGQGFENSFLSNLKIIGSYALNSGQGEILLELGKSQLKNLPLDRLNLDVATTKNVIKINSSNVSLFGGNILAQGGLKTKEQTFAFKGSANGIDLGNLSTTLAPQAPVSVSGTLKDTAFKVSGATNSMPASLEGPVDASIIKGAINGVGIVGEALSQINKLPGLSGDNLSKAVQEEHKAALSRDKTEFDLLSVRLSLENGKIIISDLQLQHPLYIISGQGTVGFNGRIDLATQLKLTSVLAEGMMLKEPKLRLLLDANGNLVFPVLVKKEGSIPVVIPDVSQLLTRAAKNTAKEAARRELEKVAPGLGGAAGVIDSLFK